VTISQAHADLTFEEKSNLDGVLPEEGVAPNYASEIHLFNEMVNQIKASCDKQSKNLVNGISF
jgi:energy-converting hydrogenase Eha subunit H